MKKTKDILIFIFALCIVSAIGYGIFLYFYVNKKYAEVPENKTELILESQSENNFNLIEFLENPINLKVFKARKNTTRITTSVANGLNYQYHPKIRDSIFYGYNFITDSVRPKAINEIVVFKYGENKHKFEDETEILIEMKIFNKDSDLGKANLIGLSKTELDTKFGIAHLTFDNGIAYSNKNKVLILELDKSKVKSYRYVKLNTEKIDVDLIGQIIK